MTTFKKQPTRLQRARIKRRADNARLRLVQVFGFGGKPPLAPGAKGETLGQARARAKVLAAKGQWWGRGEPPAGWGCATAPSTPAAANEGMRIDPSWGWQSAR